MNKRKGTTLLLLFALAVSLLRGFAPASAAQNTQSAGADGYIVRLKDADAGQAVLRSVPELREVEASQGLYHADTLEEVQALGSRVASCEPDYKVHLLTLPDDPYISGEWSVDSLGMETAWDAGYTGSGVRVGVIDSGVNSMHEDFAGTKFDRGYNVLNGSHDVTDESGHGTLVCGVLAETMNNGIGFAGLVPDVTLVPIKCFGKSEETSSSYIIRAIYAAVDDYHCDVINLSLGMTEDAPSMKRAVEYAAGKGVIVVSAVGNDGTGTYNYPAAYDCVTGVGAVNEAGEIPDFSQKNDSVYVVAPGVDIYGPSYASDDGYAKGSGTSFSAPHAAAAAVILKQYAPQATYFDFETLLRRSVTDEGASGYDTSYGWGSLSIKNFISAMKAYDFRDIGVAFPDVNGHWAEQDIRYCVSARLFSGVSATSFAPEMNMSRAMFVTVLSRLSGTDLSGYRNAFDDVPYDAWYAQACAWGAATGLVAGTGGNLFSPDDNVTREQMALFLYRYARAAGTLGNYSETALSAYTDRAQVSDYAGEAMRWAVSRGFITGRTASTLAPRETAGRSEVAAILARFVNSTAAY